MTSTRTQLPPLATLRAASLTALAGALAGPLAVGCVDSEAPPEPTPQANVAYGSTLWIKDVTIAARPMRHCLLLGAIEGPSGTRTTTVVGGENWDDDGAAVNCNLRLTGSDADRVLAVDVLEVTNRLFQLCVDSGVCRRPDPADVDKTPVCRSEDAFATCPVAAVPLDEAERVCSFLGRRLPSGIEHLIMRQGNKPATAADVRAWPFETNPPTGNNCDEAVLKNCAKPYPSTDVAPISGAARLDKSPQGVFDLSGNLSEWSADRMSPQRDVLAGLPWFCTGIVEGTTCPRGASCVYGTFRHPMTMTIGEYPVCLTDPDLRFTNGSIGTAWGGSFTSDALPDSAGTFARREKADPSKIPVDAQFGVRCVGVAGVEGSGAPAAVLTE